MFDSIQNVNDFLSEHWLAEVFPGKLKDLSKRWKELADQDKKTPLRGLASMSGGYLKALGDLPTPQASDYGQRVTELHTGLLAAVGLEVEPTTLETTQAETTIDVPLLGRFPSATTTDALHILQAVPVDTTDALFGGDAELVDPLRVHVTREKTDEIASVTEAITQLFVSDDPPRYLLVIGGGALLLTDVARWAEGRYLAFDVATALDRRDEKAAGELAYHAGLWSSDALLPDDDGKTELDHYTEDSEKHAVGVSEDLREGLRISIEKIANEVLTRRRAAALPVEGIPELPRDLTTQSLRFLYRILFLLFAEARPELGVLPVGAPEYESGYGLDRLRELVQVPLTGRSADGRHLHESLDRLFRLVNTGHNPGKENNDALVFEPLRSDLFDPQKTPLIDGANMRLSNRVLQEVLNLLLLSKPSKNKNKHRGYISYAQLGINQLGAVYEGLMSYSGLIADDDMVEVAKDGNADKGSWLVPSTKSDEYDEKDIVWREDRLTGRRDIVRHPKGSFVFRLSGRDRQRSASYYTPEVLTKCVVKHALAELITDDTTAADILEYRICEPALGSGAFLNEAINQLAAEYLSRRQDELKERIKPEAYTAELQKVKAYLALHRAYGVDLNSTAVELAEVSLWLNVMHRGLQAPWFGLHLRRGNSLIGARRATYDFTALGRAKKSWLKTPPVDRPLSEGGIGDGEIHHFLLPADGWAAVADAKQAKELAPDEAASLLKWRKSVTAKKPDAKQLNRLKALATRVERLWALVLRRLEISEQQISRQIDVWGAKLPVVDHAVDRTRVEEELYDPEGPYDRLRLAMDAWCALWFWPLTGSVEDSDDGHPGPPDLDEWIVTLEELLGAAGITKVDKSQASFQDLAEGFDELALIDDREREFSGMRSIPDLVVRHQWLGTARAIAQDQGFFHWELDFATEFKRGGFDLQVGNPPWVRPAWNDDAALSEFDPYFTLQAKISTPVFDTRRHSVLRDASNRGRYLRDLSGWAGTVERLGSPIEHPRLIGLKVNLYTNFMEKVWRNAREEGVSGLIHPEGHFVDPKAGQLRAAAYELQTKYFNFIEANRWFDGVESPSQTFGLHFYRKSKRAILGFDMVTNLQSVDTLDGSYVVQSDSDDIPGTSYAWGQRDLRPHSSRIMHVDSSVLGECAKLFDPVGTAANEARLFRPVTKEHLEILSVLSGQRRRLADIGYRWTLVWDEKKAKTDRRIEWRTKYPPSWSEVVYQGPHFTVATPFAKEPNEFCKSKNDYSAWDLEVLPEYVIPRTNYQRACERDQYEAGISRWDGRLATDYWRIAWRRRVDYSTYRTFEAALVPPGLAHVHTVHSCTVSTCVSPVHTVPDFSARAEDMLNTALVAGLWASLPFDYLVKVSGKSDVHADLIDRLPAPIDSDASPYLLQRTLRLNCLTRDYAPLWEGLHLACFAEDEWSPSFASYLAGADIMAVGERKWSMLTPLRTDLVRRAALVEIDALAALMLGLTADHLVLMFRAQFPTLRKYEYEMYFDAKGRKIAKDHHAHGVRQQKEDYKLLQAWMNGEDSGDLLDRYTPFAPDETHDGPWFYKPDREAEMRAAYADFEQRLADG
ncbi:MAG: restriction endonuclease subunit M [Gordonia sp.]|uniref:Eco57I restriction-modification methylase domain-containing protein n=1 Tax=Gordonia sp. (in: high G+C Gram-positive bacteria) TaxID=84139 RepID=UPI000C4B006D|nr:restriction endonuclease subunit M [Gordonia sp. (in: high G+C Gram-positive bacteria)]MAU84681.1 restriction endonuclease subunit M [Gordonia sp. (in: high G+C Gram-positive bacteria)]